MATGALVAGATTGIGLVSSGLGAGIVMCCTAGFTSVFTTTGSVYVGGDVGAAGGTGLLSAGSGGVANIAGTLRVWSGSLTVAGAVSANAVDLVGGINSVAAGGALTVGAGGLSLSGSSNVLALS